MSLSGEQLMVVRFGVFEADFRTWELRRNGARIRIQDLPFRTLQLLLSNPGEVVSREEFRQALWTDGVFVDFDRGIRSAIKRLRDALGDSADNPIFIETVERRGYRWIAPLHFPESAGLPQAAVVVAPIPPDASQPSSRLRWLAYALPVVALLFGFWSFRSSTRSAQADVQTRPATPASGHHAANREAENFYREGRFYWNKRTPESLNQALDSFTQAIVRDPNYADAYVGLADCYNLLREYSSMPPQEAYPRALAAAKKAVELDDRSSEAHASLAFASFYGMWDVRLADKEFRRAIELDPGNAKAHHWYATFLELLRRHEQALSEIDIAQTLDPHSAAILADKGLLLWETGHEEEGIKLLRHLEVADPNAVSPHRYLRIVGFERGDYASAFAEMKQESLLTHDANLLAMAAVEQKGLARNGRQGLYEAQLQEQKRLYSLKKISPYSLAQGYARLGNTQEALNYLKISYDLHADQMVTVGVDSAFEPLHHTPAFEQLLNQVGLPSFN